MKTFEMFAETTNGLFYEFEVQATSQDKAIGASLEYLATMGVDEWDVLYVGVDH